MSLIGGLKIIGGLIVTLFGLMWFIWGGTIPMIVGGPQMILGFMVMVVGGYLTWKGTKHVEGPKERFVEKGITYVKE